MRMEQMPTCDDQTRQFQPGGRVIRRLWLGLILLASGLQLFAQQYIISTLAGGAPPQMQPVATNAAIGSPWGVAVDASGNVYFTSLNCVFRMNRDGSLNRLAGNGVAGYSGDSGPATSAQLNDPEGLAVDGLGNIYIADLYNNGVRKIAPNGTITTLVQIAYPEGIAIDTSNNVYVTTGNVVVRISPDGTAARVAGTYDFTSFNHYSGDGGPATQAELYGPKGLAVDNIGNLYIADTDNNCVRKVDTKGIISTVIGQGGIGARSILGGPTGVAVDQNGNLFVADLGNNRIRKIDANGIVTTVTGSDIQGYSGDGGPASSALVEGPISVAVDSTNNLYLSDAGNDRIRKISSGGIITTVAGNGTLGYSGDGGSATNATLANPWGVALDRSGNIYLADSGDGRIRKISSAGIISTIDASVSLPSGLAVDAAGSLYYADGYANVIRKATPNGALGIFAGNGQKGYAGDGGPAMAAQFNLPLGVALDGHDNLYIADDGNRRIRKISSDGIVTTVAGNGSGGYSGDGGPATAAQLSSPSAVVVNAQDNIYIGSAGFLPGQFVRNVSASGIITRGASNPVQGSFGGLAIATDSASNLYMGSASSAGSTLSEVSILKVAGTEIISRIAGNGTVGYSGDGGLATNAQLSNVGGVAVDNGGNIFFTDYNAVRVLRPIPGPYPEVTAITHAASSLSAPLAPGEIFVLYGTGMGPAQLAPMHINDQGLVDTTLAETQVTFNGVPAPIVYTSDKQLAAIVPYGTKGRSADMVVTYQGHPTNPMPVLIQASSPGLFTADSTGQGQAAAINQDGTINSPANPAAAGTYISLYATGEGQTNPAGTDGKPATAPLPKPVLPVTVTIAGQPATVQYAGAAPGLVAGVLQVNAQIPATTPPGNAPVVIQVGTTKSQANVTIAVR